MHVKEKIISEIDDNYVDLNCRKICLGPNQIPNKQYSLDEFLTDWMRRDRIVQFYVISTDGNVEILYNCGSQDILNEDLTVTTMFVENTIHYNSTMMCAKATDDRIYGIFIVEIEDDRSYIGLVEIHSDKENHTAFDSAYKEGKSQCEIKNQLEAIKDVNPKDVTVITASGGIINDNIDVIVEKFGPVRISIKHTIKGSYDDTVIYQDTPGMNDHYIFNGPCIEKLESSGVQIEGTEEVTVRDMYHRYSKWGMFGYKKSVSEFIDSLSDIQWSAPAKFVTYFNDECEENYVANKYSRLRNIVHSCIGSPKLVLITIEHYMKYSELVLLFGTDGEEVGYIVIYMDRADAEKIHKVAIRISELETITENDCDIIEWDFGNIVD